MACLIARWDAFIPRVGPLNIAVAASRIAKYTNTVVGYIEAQATLWNAIFSAVCSRRGF